MMVTVPFGLPSIGSLGRTRLAAEMVAADVVVGVAAWAMGGGVAATAPATASVRTKRRRVIMIGFPQFVSCI